MVAYGANGSFLVAWHSYYQDGSDWGVYAQLYGTGSTQADLMPVHVTGPAGR